MSRTSVMQAAVDQRRARLAWKTIQDVKENESQEVQGKFARHAKQMPMRVMTSGLGPAYAYVLAKAKKAHVLKKLLDSLSRWVCEQVGVVNGEGNLLEQIMQDEDGSYLQEATDETMAYLKWLKRFAEAELADSDTED